MADPAAAASPNTDASSSVPDPAAPDSTVLNMLHNTKVDGGKSAWTMTMETFGMHDGKREKGDTLCTTEDEAMKALKAMVHAAQAEHEKWSFSLTPLDLLKATLDDLLLAFVLWSLKEDKPEFNVSKSFRRLESYVSWMDQHQKELEEPLTIESMLPAMKAWALKLTHDKEGRLVWWISLGDIDMQAVKRTVSQQDSLRYLVWLSHVVMLDKQAQANGIILMQSMGNLGMIHTMTMVPMDLGTKLDRFTIGVVPLKMKAIYTFNHNMWLKVMLGFFKPFMSSKMRERFKSIPKDVDLQFAIDECVGRQSIPIGYAGLTGVVQKDIVETLLMELQSSM